MNTILFKKIAGIVAFIVAIYMAFQAKDNPQWLLGAGIVGAVGWLWVFSNGLKLKPEPPSAKIDPSEKFFNNLSFMGAGGIFVVTLAIWAVIAL